MEKIDLKKRFKHLYLPTAKKVSVVQVPALKFIMIDGQIPAGILPADSVDFQNALQALYGLSYTLKFISKLREDNPIDYTVMALEGLWWTETGDFDLPTDQDWFFRAMMLQPDHISQDMIQEAAAKVAEKGENPALAKANFGEFHEGLSIQIMHIGPYADEGNTLEVMRVFARENGYRYRGRHHEIYIGDPRRAKPKNLKTVLRQPVKEMD